MAAGNKATEKKKATKSTQRAPQPKKAVSNSTEPVEEKVAKKSYSRDNSQNKIPEVIYAQASPKFIGGTSLFDAGENVNSDTAINFTSEKHLIAASITKLREAGFQVLQATNSTINISGSVDTFKAVFNAPIHIEQREVIKEFGRKDVAEYLDCNNCDLPGLISVKGSSMDDVLEGIAIEEPQYFMIANAFPPNVDYWHLNVPADVSMGCNADLAHRAGITGRGVVISMVDSGWFRHPFFTRRGYRSDNAVLAPGASNPFDDESGHGTGESANVFSLAPDTHLKPVKMNFVNTIAAFNTAVSLNPDIITCSWGSSIQFGPLTAARIVMANAISAAVKSGITVVFSAGNGHWGFPGQHPDVISAGGVDIRPDGSMRASDYASGFASNIYPGRNVPDLSGIVGMRPKAMNIMLPLQPGDSIDTTNAGGNHPNRDETAKDDGWAAFSGTSAAAPQLAGAAALILQANAQLKPREIKDILKTTANDVTEGSCSPDTGGNPASVGADLATGSGLVDAHRATLLARIYSHRSSAEHKITGSVQRNIPIVSTVQSVKLIEPLQQTQEVTANGPLSTANNVSKQPHIGHVFDELDLPALENMILDRQIDPSEF